MIKSFIFSLLLTTLVGFLVTPQTDAATISHNSTTLISSNSDFTVSVFNGAAGYTGLASGTFGDGTVEAYAFARNTLLGASYNDNEIGFYATGGSNITIDSYVGATTFANFDRGDVWTSNDPASQAANYGGTTETISGGHDVIGTIDISNYSAGTIYVLLGSYDNPFDLSLTFNGGPTVSMAQVDPATTRNIYVAAFSFDDAAKDYTSIEYNYNSQSQGRARFMGVVVNGVAIPEPSTALLSGIGIILLLRRRR